MGLNGKWDFDAPKYWDLTERNVSKRPTDAWFSTETISPASFEKKMLPHSLQPIFTSHKIGLDSFMKKKQLPKTMKQKPTTVFERLHKDSTISSALKHSSKTSQKKVYPHGEKILKTSPSRSNPKTIQSQQAFYSSQPPRDKSNETQSKGRQRDDGMVLISPTSVYSDNNPVVSMTPMVHNAPKAVDTESTEEYREEQIIHEDSLVVEPDKSEAANNVVEVEIKDDKKVEPTSNENEIVTNDYLDTRIEEAREQLSEFGVSSRMEPYFKRKHIYINCDRMNETIKRAKLVLEESRRKSEQWHLNKKSVHRA